MDTSDKNLITFKAIGNFVNDLAEMYSLKQYSLKLYSHLINKTTLIHNKAISKHIEAFKKFCVINNESILKKDFETFKVNKIKYSEKAFIDMKKIFKMADRDSQNVIWKHLLTISALTDPKSKAKEILKKDNSNEGDFLNNIISKVEQHVTGEESNPMEAVTKLIQSGVLTDVVSDMNKGIKDGSIDLGKMLGSVQNVMTEMGGNSGIDMNSMVSNMMSSMGSMNPDGSGPEGFNPQNMMAMLSNLQPNNSELPSLSDSKPDITEDDS